MPYMKPNGILVRAYIRNEYFSQQWLCPIMYFAVETTTVDDLLTNIVRLAQYFLNTGSEDVKTYEQSSHNVRGEKSSA